MKKLFILLTLSLVCFNITQAQIFVREYFTKDNQPATEVGSDYFRVGKKIPMWRGEKERWIDTVFIDTVKTFCTSTHAIRSREVYRGGDLEGLYNFYHENGKIKEKGNYSENLKVGYVTSWYAKGAVKQTLQYFKAPGSRPGIGQNSFKIINYWDESGNQLIKDGAGYCKCYLAPDGPLEEGRVISGYRDSVWQIFSGDTLTSFEQYKTGTFVEGESVYKDNRIKYSQQFVQAEFRGGLSGMMKFLQKNIRYPSGAKTAGVQGRIFVRFWIDSYGNVSNIGLVKGVRKDLNEEAMRVVRISGPWVPALWRGIPTKSIFVLPVYFKLDF